MPIKLALEFKTGIPIIDEQHGELVDTLNRLYEAVSKLEADEKFPELLKEFMNYKMKHFTTEEKFFDDYGYPGAEEHKQEHKKFEKKMNEFSERIKNTDKTDLAYELVEYVENWFVNHLETMDQKYIPFFVEKGVAKL